MSKTVIKMKRLNKLSAVFIILVLVVLSVGLVNAGYVKFCLTENQVIRYSLCSPDIPDYACTSATCQICVNEISSGIYCPGNPTSCSSGSCISLPGSNSTNQTVNFNVTLVSPSAGQAYNLTSSQTEKSVGFKYTMTPSSSYANITSCSLLLNSISVAQNTSKINSSINSISASLSPGQYTWAISCADKNNFTSYSPTRIITIYSAYQITLPNITLISPINNYTTNGSQTIPFQYNLTSTTNITSCNLYINNVLSASNATAISSSTNTISKLLNPGNYSWYISCNHKSGNSTFSSMRTMAILQNPVQLPNITLISPINNYVINLTSNQSNTTIPFQYNLTSTTNITSCNLYINNILTMTNSSKILTTNSFSKLLYQGAYSWYVSCPHSSGSSIKSESRTVYINHYSNSTNSSSQIIQVILLSPENEKTINSPVSINQTFSFTFNNTNISKILQCSLLIGNQSISNQTLINETNNIIYPLDTGKYSWKVSCTNSSLSVIESESRNITLTNQTSNPNPEDNGDGGGGGGGGGGGSSSTKPQNTTNSSNTTAKQETIPKPETNLLNETSITTNSTKHLGITASVIGTFEEMPYIPAIIFVIIVGSCGILIYRRKKMKK